MNTSTKYSGGSGSKVIHGHAVRGRVSPTWNSWDGMIKRCTRPKHHAFARYGGRGISVCKKWETFDGFLEDMGERPAGLELDRVNNDGNYEPGNCRWATRKEQARNRVSNHRLAYDGESLTIAEWAERSNLPVDALVQRIANKWSIERALTQPLRITASRR